MPSALHPTHSATARIPRRNRAALPPGRLLPLFGWPVGWRALSATARLLCAPPSPACAAQARWQRWRALGYEALEDEGGVETTNTMVSSMKAVFTSLGASSSSSGSGGGGKGGAHQGRAAMLGMSCACTHVACARDLCVCMHICGCTRMRMARAARAGWHVLARACVRVRGAALACALLACAALAWATAPGQLMGFGMGAMCSPVSASS